MPPRFLCEVISIFSMKIWYCKICKKCYQITNIRKINLFFGCFLKTIGASYNWYMPNGFVWSGGPEILNTNIDLMRTDAKRGNGHM